MHTCTWAHGSKGKFQLSLKVLWKTLRCSNHIIIEKNLDLGDFIYTTQREISVSPFLCIAMLNYKSLFLVLHISINLKI